LMIQKPSERNASLYEAPRKMERILPPPIIEPRCSELRVNAKVRESALRRDISGFDSLSPSGSDDRNATPGRDDTRARKKK